MTLGFSKSIDVLGRFEEVGEEDECQIDSSRRDDLGPKELFCSPADKQKYTSSGMRYRPGLFEVKSMINRSPMAEKSREVVTQRKPNLHKGQRKPTDFLTSSQQA